MIPRFRKKLDTCAQNAAENESFQTSVCGRITCDIRTLEIVNCKPE